MLSFLADRTYWHLFLAQIVALLGTGLATIALGLLAYDLSGERAGLVLGTIFTIKMVAYQQIAFEELKRAIDQIEARIATLDQTIETAIKSWHFAPVVDALQALRGINTTIAATVVAEIGDITRFENPRQLMAWLGLVPSEHSSGSNIRRGRLTKTGNALARTMLVEAGWSYRHPPKEGHPYLKRPAHLPQQIKDIGWKAQTRLCNRYRHLSRVGKPQPRVIAAIARELAGSFGI